MYANRALRTVAPIRFDAWLAPVVDTTGAYYTGTGSPDLATLEAFDIGEVVFHPPAILPLLASAARVDVAHPSNQILGGLGPFDPPAFTRPGLTAVYEFLVTGLVSGAGLTGRFEVVDDLGAVVATRDVTDTTLTAYTTTFTAPGGPRFYELRAKLLASAGPSDYCTPVFAALRISWS